MNLSMSNTVSRVLKPLVLFLVGACPPSQEYVFLLS